MTTTPSKKVPLPRRRLIVGAALSAAVSLGASVAWACTPQHAGSLSVSPEAGASPGQTVWLTGSGLWPNAVYDVLFLDPKLVSAGATATCFASGAPMQPNPFVRTTPIGTFGPVTERIPAVQQKGLAVICANFAKTSGAMKYYTIT